MNLGPAPSQQYFCRKPGVLFPASVVPENAAIGVGYPAQGRKIVYNVKKIFVVFICS